MTNPPSIRAVAVLAAALPAAALPSLLAFNVSPSPTFLNQALALGGWGGFAFVLALGQRAQARLGASVAAAPAQLALLLLLLATAVSGTFGALPSPLCLSSLGLLGAAALMVHSGSDTRADLEANALFERFLWAWLATGVFNLAIGMVQVFAPQWPDGDWVAASNIVGRAVGNLRQPNHLSSLLVWSAIAGVALLQMRRLAPVAAWVLVAGFVFGVVLSASRTGLVSVGVLALWGLLDRQASRGTRALLLAAPVFYGLSWLGMAQWAALSHHTFGGAARVAETDISGSRFGIWSNTLAMIRAEPWTGVGFGEFNFAWTLSAFPNRPTAFFDHTHNLPLQLAVELGLPLAALVLGLLLWALVRMARRAWAAEGDDAVTRRAALMFVLMIALHSLLEYPLWYAYFLLPAAWACGFALGGPAVPAAERRGRRWMLVATAVLVTGAALSLRDYTTVTSIFSADENGTPLAERIARGQRSWFFAHHADYAAATTEVEPRLREHAFDHATHFLLDTRLMMAWAEELAAQGDLERARYLADRVREFRNPASKPWFVPCDQPPPAGAERPFQCTPARGPHSWREFLPRR